MLRSRRRLRYAAPLALTCLLAACSDNGREPLLSETQPIEIPPADTTTQTNINISNPSLQIPTTFPVADGDALTLVWSDEFDGAQLDPETWFFESGDGSQYGIPGWGNNEQQWYLPDNARLENGLLIIEAARETVGQFDYTSARITTKDRFAVQYGRIEARMKLPAGQGLWPAFWMLPQDDEQGSAPADGVYGGFSASGEIDIMEAVNLGGNPGPAGLGGGNDVFGTIHFGGEFPANQFTTVEYEVPESLTDGFNTFAVEWDEFEIRWYVNGTLFASQNSWFSAAAPYPAPFDQPFKILLNLAVGGSLPGSPNGSTPFPSTMEVDWVRVYSGEAPGGGMPTEPADPAPAPSEDPADVVSLFSDAYTDAVSANFNLDAGQATQFSEAQIAGNQLLQYANLDFAIIDFSATPQDVSDNGVLHLDVWTADSTELEVFLISPGPVETGVSVPVTANSWVSVDIPLEDFAPVDLTNIIQLKFEGNGTIFVDNLYFAGDAPVVEPPGGELLTNGDFEAGQDPWIGQATVIDDGGNNVLQGVVTSPDPGQPFLVNATQVVPLTEGETYTLTFRARSTQARSMLAGIGLNVAPFTAVTESVPLTTEWQAYTYTLTATGFGGPDSRVLFDMNGEAGDVFIDDVSLTVGSLLTNGDFEAGQDPWIGQATVIDDGGNNVLQGVVTSPDPGQPFLVNASQVLDLTQDELYVLTFKARSTQARSMLAGIGLNVAPFTAETRSVPLTTEWQTFTYTIPATGFGGPDSRVLFDMNGEAGDVFIDDVALAVIPPANTGSGGGGGTNIVINGGFETGMFNDGTPNANWQQFPGDGTQTITTDNPASGTYAANLAIPVRGPGDPGVDNLIKNANLEAGNLAPGASITVSFAMRGSFEGASGVVFAEVFSELSGGGTSKNEILTGGPLPAPTADWRTETFTTTLGPDVSGGVTLQLKVGCGAVEGCGADVYFDDVSIVVDGDGSGGGGAGTAPTTSAPTPPQDPADVISLYSDAYMDPAVTWPTPWSVPNDTTSDVTIDGGTVKEHLNVSFIGVEFASTDVSGMTHLHLDVWTPDADSLLVRLVDFGGDGFGGGNDTQGDLTFDSGSTPALSQGSWVSLDIPLSDFQAAGLGSLTDLNQLVLDAAPDGVALYIDNLYFYNDAGGGGGGGGGGGTNIVINGGFETGMFNDGTPNANWQQFPGDGTQTITTDNPASGTYAANLGIPVRGPGDPGVDNLIKNANLEAGNLAPGASITVSFAIRGSLSGAGGVVFAEVFSELSGGGTSKNEILSGGPLPAPTADWRTETFTTTLGPDVSGGVTLQLKAGCGDVEGCGADVYFDDVSIVVN